MYRIPVHSSNIKSIGYDESLKILEIEFHDGRIYEYEGVPREVYEGLMNAPSHGKYFHTNIRSGFPYRRIQ